eukprot:TRINITY_DN12499_c0_g2_i1.p1 TRINITY_DN12499_c0_g2~~TRINITY_DN12499_c0_g2_i1.p1  ORF type:complete len:144 (-),score=17.70 TRINITY_DN12499_c0_g2_i1:98-529(-)
MLSRWHVPFDDVDLVVQTLNEALQPTKTHRRVITPRSIPVDITETPQSWHIHADLPGIPKDNVHVSVDKHILTITAESKSEFEGSDKDTKRHMLERRYGKIERRFQLPESADVNKADAKCEDGVLKLVFGKKEEARKKMISLL